MDSPATVARKTSSRTNAQTNGSTDMISSPSYALRKRTSKINYKEEDPVPLAPLKRSKVKDARVNSPLPVKATVPEVIDIIQENEDLIRKDKDKKKKKKKEIWKCTVIVNNNEADRYADAEKMYDLNVGFDLKDITTKAVESPSVSVSASVEVEGEHHWASGGATATPEAKTISNKKGANHSCRTRTISPAPSKISTPKKDSVFKLCEGISSSSSTSTTTPSKSKILSPYVNLGPSVVKSAKTNKILTEVHNIGTLAPVPVESINLDEEEKMDSMEGYKLVENVMVTKTSLETSFNTYMQQSAVNNCSMLKIDKSMSGSTSFFMNSPRTPKEKLWQNKNLNVSQGQETPTRSSTRIQAQQQTSQPSVVRRLDSSLCEVSCSSNNTTLSPAKPQASARPTRKITKKSYAEDYFDYSSSEVSDLDGSVDSDSDSGSNESNASDRDSGDEEEEKRITHTKSVSGLDTPSKLVQMENPSLCLTPKVVKAVSKISNNDFSPRRTPDIKNVRNTPSSESYFTAEKRIRFKSEQVVRKMEKARKVNEAKKGPKKPRKGNRQGIDKSLKNFPLIAPNFSVTKELAKISLDSVDEFVNPWQEEHAEALEELHHQISRDFPRWIILLKEGFSIMLHGYGSKQPIYDTFSEFLNNKFLIVTINGLFPKFYPRKFLQNFITNLDLDSDIKFTGTNIHSITEELLTKLTEKGNSHPPVFIYAMNFDIMAARHHQMLTCICALARVPWIYVIASSDHVNTGLGISPFENLQLKTVWLDCTTFVPYSNEMVWNSNLLGASADASIAKNSIEHIFKSLTSNAKKAFGFLAGLQLQKLKTRGSKTKGKSFQGVEFRELFRKCREAFIAHSELVLKSLLTEFIDHKLIHFSGKGKHDDNFLIVDLDENTLEKYAES